MGKALSSTVIPEADRPRPRCCAIRRLPTEMVQKITWQVLSAIEFCHQNDVSTRSHSAFYADCPRNVFADEVFDTRRLFQCLRRWCTGM